MSEPIKNGGLAFPAVEFQYEESRDVNGQSFPYAPASHGGMSLRDYFAAAALTGLLVKWSPSSRASERELAMGEFGAAVGAYRIADAMLKAREQDSEEVS